jgi:AcrR family transcriptional regulator
VTTDSSSDERLWGGTTLSDRRATRRTQLLEAGLDLLGGPGPATVAVRAVCRRARLTERYFYESFPDRDALVAAVYETVADEAQRALEAATRRTTDRVEVARAAVEAMVELIVDDPRKGRVLLVAPITEPVLATRTLELAPTVAAMIREQLSPGVSEQDRDLIATGLLGALMGLFYAYLQGTLRVSRSALVEHCVRVLLSARRLET